MKGHTQGSFLSESGNYRLAFALLYIYIRGKKKKADDEKLTKKEWTKIKSLSFEEKRRQRGNQKHISLSLPVSVPFCSQRIRTLRGGLIRRMLLSFSSP